MILIAESDLIPGIGTFIACLVLQLEVGIAFGVGINVLFILYHAARPKISVEKLKVIEQVVLYMYYLSKSKIVKFSLFQSVKIFSLINK